MMRPVSTAVCLGLGLLILTLLFAGFQLFLGVTHLDPGYLSFLLYLALLIFFIVLFIVLRLRRHFNEILEKKNAKMKERRTRRREAKILESATEGPPSKWFD